MKNNSYDVAPHSGKKTIFCAKCVTGKFPIFSFRFACHERKVKTTERLSSLALTLAQSNLNLTFPYAKLLRTLELEIYSGWLWRAPEQTSAFAVKPLWNVLRRFLCEYFPLPSPWVRPGVIQENNKSVCMRYISVLPDGLLRQVRLTLSSSLAQRKRCEILCAFFTSLNLNFDIWQVWTVLMEFAQKNTLCLYPCTYEKNWIEMKRFS